MRRITIVDIAKLAGVSPSTVSRALNDTGQISKKLRIKIKQIARSLKFKLNTNAVNFKNRETKIIALIVPEVSMFFTPSLIQGITETLNKANYQLSIYITNNKLRQEIESINNSLAINADGIIISFSTETKNIIHLNTTIELDVPVMIIDKSLDQKKHSEVVFNNYHDSRLCCEFLKDYNPKKVLGIFGSLSLSMTKDRLVAFQEYFPSETSKTIHAESTSIAFDMIQSISLEDFDAFYCMSDEVLLGLIKNINDQYTSGFCKPIICLSDGELPKFIHPKVSYLKHDGRQMGIIASNQLLSEITNTQTERRQIEISSEIENKL